MELARLRTLARAMGARRSDWEQAVNEAADEIERLNREGVPGQMHEVDRAFHKLTVLQRDLAWSEVEAMRSVIKLQRSRLRQSDKVMAAARDVLATAHEGFREDIDFTGLWRALIEAGWMRYDPDDWRDDGWKPDPLQAT